VDHPAVAPVTRDLMEKDTVDFLVRAEEKDTAVHHLEVLMTVATEKVKILREVFHHRAAPVIAPMERVKTPSTVFYLLESPAIADMVKVNLSRVDTVIHPPVV